MFDLANTSSLLASSPQLPVHWHSVQTVGTNNPLARPGSPVYQKWHEQVLRYNEGKALPHSAIWMVYYPNIMIEGTRMH